MLASTAPRFTAAIRQARMERVASHEDQPYFAGAMEAMRRREAGDYAGDAELTELYRREGILFAPVGVDPTPVLDALVLAGDNADALGHFNEQIAGSMDHRAALAHVTAPTLVITGSEDAFVSGAHEIAEALPDGRLVVLEGVDHFPFLEPGHEAPWSRAVLDFLGKLGGLGADDAVAAGGLRAVEGRVGDADELGPVVGVGGEDRPADRGREGPAAAGLDCERANGLAGSVEQVGDAVGVGRLEQHGELLAAEAVDAVRAAQDMADGLAGPAEHGVALRVAERVVHVLEVVEVDHREREPEVTPLRHRHAAPELRLEGGGWEPGERVVARGRLQLLLAEHRPPQRREVAEHEVERVMVEIVATPGREADDTCGPRPRHPPGGRCG